MQAASYAGRSYHFLLVRMFLILVSSFYIIQVIHHKFLFQQKNENDWVRGRMQKQLPPAKYIYQTAVKRSGSFPVLTPSAP
jgi:hypothetical protein